MMKPKYAALILSALLLLTCSCGKTADSTPSGSSEPAEVLSRVPSSAESVAEPLSIREIVCEEGTFTDEEGEECSYSYRIPQLDADTPDARAINDEIQATYEDIFTECQESLEQKRAPEYLRIEWVSYQNGPVVSIVLNTVYTFTEITDNYRVYNYDADHKTQLFLPDLLARKNLSEDAYLAALRRTAVQRFDDDFFESFSYPDWVDLYREDYAERRSWSCSNETVADPQLTYFDANGDLAAVVTLGALAEVEAFTEPLTVDLRERPPVFLEDSYDDLFSATLENGELTVFCPAKGETAAADAYPVHGRYSDYTQVLCGMAQESGYAYVFLLTEDGRVEFVDVSEGTYYHYLCVNGPILGVTDIVSLETAESEQGFDTVVAVSGSGERIDLTPHVQAYEKSIPSLYYYGTWAASIRYKNDSGEIDMDDCTLEITDWNDASLKMTNAASGSEWNYTGFFNFLGICDTGSVYAYCFANADGQTIYEGAATFVHGTVKRTDDADDTCLYWKDMSGTGIFTTAAGEEVTFTAVHG